MDVCASMMINIVYRLGLKILIWVQFILFHFPICNKIIHPHPLVIAESVMINCGIIKILYAMILLLSMTMPGSHY